MTCTCPECGGTMISGTMNGHDFLAEFLLCFKCGLIVGKAEKKERSENDHKNV